MSVETVLLWLTALVPVTLTLAGLCNVDWRNRGGL